MRKAAGPERKSDRRALIRCAANVTTAPANRAVTYESSASRAKPEKLPKGLPSFISVAHGLVAAWCARSL